MIAKNWTHLMTLLLTSTLIISGCSLIPSKKVEIVSKPLEIDIIQPTMPRNIDLKDPKFYVVSEAKIANPCVKNKETGKRDCSLGKENPDWPEGYTYLDRFMDDMKELNGGEVVFVATTVGDYKVMAEDMQELKRYIKQLGEVVIYYRNVTMPDGDKGQGVGIKIDKPTTEEEIRG